MRSFAWNGLVGLMLFASVSMVAAADSLPHLVGKESNVTLSDMSPMLSWSPSASGPMDGTWNQTWTDASWADYTPLWPIVRMDDGRMPVSSHTTQYVGASVSLDFMGTAIYFFGTGKGSVSVDVGGKKSDIDVDLSAIGVIASVSGLDNAAQKASVTLKSGEISINSVIVTVQVGGQGATIVNSTYHSYDETEKFYFLGSNITWSKETTDEWKMNSSMCGEYGTPQNTSCWATPRAQTNTPNAKFIIQPPANTSYLSLWTTTGSEEGPFSVTIDPPLFDGQTTTSYTQGNPWLAIPVVVMFFTPLDFRKTYTITVEFTGESNQYLNFLGGRMLTTSGGDMTQPGGTGASTGTGSGNGNGTANGDTTNNSGNNTGDSSSSKTPIGAIVGGVVGGIAALAIAGLVIFFCCCRRRKTSKEDDFVPLGQTKRRKPKGFLRRPPSGLSDFEVDVSDKPVYDMDANQSHPSLHAATGAELNVTPLTISGPTPPGPAGMRTADQKALEAARESAANIGSPIHAYPPSPAGYGTPVHSQGSQGPSSPTISGSEGSTDPGGFRTYQSPTSSRNNNSHGQNQFIVNNPNPNAQTSDYAYSHGPVSSQHHSPVSPATTKASWTTSSAYQSARQPAPLPPLAAHAAVAEEVDAGRIVQPKESVPPRYNPAWADEDDPLRRV